MRFILGLLLAFLAIFLYTTPALAADEFSTSYQVNYDVSEDGTTQVTQKVDLKNLTSQYYVNNFTLNIGSTTVTDVQASDEEGSMETSVNAQDQRTSILVKFNRQVAGLGKTQSFTLKFKSKDFAQKLGKIWEVDLPKVPPGTNVLAYDLTLSVPVSFSDPTSIYPKPKSESSNADKISFIYDKSQLEKSGVSVSFGNAQVFDYEINYPLENKSLFPVLTSITLPSDTPYQQVLVNTLDPKPENVTIDKDGNYLAWYRLPRGLKINVKAVGSVMLYIKPKTNNTKLSPDEWSAYTKSDKYWEKDNPAITGVLNQIYKDDNPTSNKEKVQSIYRYVVNNLRYSTKRLTDNNIERLGAVTALNNTDSAICMEFTDLFIALTRAAGIPAREMDGFAYSQNTTLRPLSLARDLLHSWPEYFDDQTNSWIMVDPTWENTSGGVDYFNKFDLNHFTLVTKGISSETPTISDDIKVSLSSADFTPVNKNNVTIDAPDYIWAGFPSVGMVRVENIGNTLLPPTQMVLTSTVLTILGEKQVNLGSIPPFGHTDYSFDIRTPLSWEDRDDSIIVSILGQTISKGILIKPIFTSKSYPYFAGGIAGLVVLVYLGVLTTHIIRKKWRRRRNK